MLAKEYLQSIVGEQEETYIQQFYENENMREAVRKVLLAGLYYNGVLSKNKKANALTNIALSLVSNRGDYTNEQIGADLKGLWEGINMLESAFNAMSYFKKPEEKVASKNPAR